MACHLDHKWLVLIVRCLQLRLLPLPPVLQFHQIDLDWIGVSQRNESTALPYGVGMNTIVETRFFARKVQGIWTTTEYEKFLTYISRYPNAGKLIPGTGGVRKIRWEAKGVGKRGGTRVVYYNKTMSEIWLLTLYVKIDTENIPANELEKWLTIEKERFNELVLRLFHTELEAVYEEALRKEFDNFGIPFDCQVKLNIFYDGEQLNKFYKPVCLQL